MKYTRNDLKHMHGQDIWIYQLIFGKSNKGKKARHVRPQKVKVIGNDGWPKYKKYGKRGQLLDGWYYLTDVIAVSTELEAIEGYNELVQARIDDLNKQIDETKDLMID